MSTSIADPRVTDDVFELEEWTIDPHGNRIVCGAVTVRLEPRAMEVLLCLADHQGRVVARKTIFDRVWATEFVTDSTLTHTIADLRRAFGDDPRKPRIIETIPKRGNRLIAAIRGRAGAPSAGPFEDQPLATVAANRVVVRPRAAGPPSDSLLMIGDREVFIGGGEIEIGRTTRSGLKILSSEVSRNHARLVIVDEGATIEDLGSKNGTAVNGRDIEARTDLASGDVIKIGPHEIVFCHRFNDPTKTRTSD